MAQTYNILMNRFNGTDHDPLLPKNHLNGTSDPTTSTVGIVGQFYLNITTKRLWQCTNVNGSVYTWCVLNSNKNLLDNAWFASPYLVNQRGKSIYTGGGYCVDRWFVQGGTFDVNLRKFTATANYDRISQYVDNADAYSGRAVTLSADVVNGNSPVLLLITQFTSAGPTDFAVDIPSGFNGIKYLTVALASNVIRLSVNMAVSSSDGSLTINKAKLELGSVSTLHLDTPPSPAEQELNRQVCKRYYQRIPILYAYGYCASATDAYVAVPVPVPMRITPSIIVEDNGALNFGAAIIASTGLTVVASNDNQVHIGVGGSGMIANAPCVLHDAIIALSADL